MIIAALAVLSILKTLENMKEPELKSIPFGAEIEAVKMLQDRVGPLMWNEHSKGPSTMLRWLRANKMDINRTEEMLKTHLTWRKDMNMDKRRLIPPNSNMLKRFNYNLKGHNRIGNPVLLIPFGQWDIRAYLNDGGKRRRFDLHQGQMWEKALYAIEQVEMNLVKPRKQQVQLTLVCDLGCLSFRQFSTYQSLQYIFSIVGTLESNYPEIVHKCYIINGTASKLFKNYWYRIRNYDGRTIAKNNGNDLQILFA